MQATAERIAKLSLALVNAVRAEDWSKAHDCESRLGELLEVLGDKMDSTLTMEQMGFVNDHKRTASEQELTAGVALS